MAFKTNNILVFLVICLAAMTDLFGSDERQNIYEVGPYGDLVTLYDGTQWSVEPRDSFVTSHWFEDEEVVILPNGSYPYRSAYPYLLNNLRSNTTAGVELVRGPHMASSLLRYIVSIDDLQGIVRLSDGSVWKLPRTQKLFDWCCDDFEKDIILIGLNDGPDALRRPYILLNVNHYNHLPAQRLY